MSEHRSFLTVAVWLPFPHIIASVNVVTFHRVSDESRLRLLIHFLLQDLLIVEALLLDPLVRGDDGAHRHQWVPAHVHAVGHVLFKATPAAPWVLNVCIAFWPS